MNVIVNSSHIALGLVLCAATITLIVKLRKSSFKRAVPDTMRIKKWDSYSTSYWQFGLVISLIMSYLAFNYSSPRYSNTLEYSLEKIEEIQDDIPITHFSSRKPPVVPVYPEVIEPIDEPEIIIEDTIQLSKPLTEITTLDTASLIDNSRAKAPIVPPPPPIVEDNTIWDVVQEMPHMRECHDLYSERESCTHTRLLKFIYTHIKYPKLAREFNIEGTCVISFVIDKNGNINSIEIARDLGYGLGQESKRVIKLLAEQTSWNAGKQRGHPVNVKYNIPIRFNLK